MKGVVITVYEESPSNIRPLPESKPDKNVETIPVSTKPKTKKSQGYDRRAQLLAHAQELRKPDNEDHQDQIQWQQKSSTHKSKKKWKCPSGTAKGIGVSFLGIFRKRKRKYRRMASDSEDNNNNEHNSGSGTGRENKHGRRKLLWGKLKRMFKGLSSVWQRKKV